MTDTAELRAPDTPVGDDDRYRRALLAALRVAHARVRMRRGASSMLKRRVMSYYRCGFLSMAQTHKLIDLFRLWDA